MVFAICLSRTGDRDTAEDLTQDVFVTVHERLPSLRDPQRFAGWLRRIAANACNLWARKHPPNVAWDETEAASVAEPVVSRVGREERMAIRDAMRALSENSRVILVLHYACGYSYREIAAVLELPVVTVRSRLHEARQQMRRELLKVVKEQLRMRLLPDELIEQVLSRCGSKACTCAQEVLNP